VSATINPGVFFSLPRVLPRGRNALARERVVAIQRERIMTALVELMAERGYHGFSVGDIATRASVSRSAFYECFESKEECAFSAYDRFIGVLLDRIAARTLATSSWDDFVAGLIGGYLDTLRRDLVVARAFQVEMDAIGAPARARRRDALVRFADHIRAQHERLRPIDPTLQPADREAYLGAVYAVRQVASDALDEERRPDLMALAAPLARWVAQSFRSAPQESGSAVRSARAAHVGGS
jgi:AcrR family transcriptional regulator